MVHFRFRLCVFPVFVTAYDPFLVCIFFKCSANIYAYMNCASQKCGNITRRPLPANQCVREATSGAHLPQSPQRPFAENLLTNGAFDWQLAKWQTGIGQLVNGKGKLDFACLCAAGHSVGNLWGRWRSEAFWHPLHPLPLQLASIVPSPLSSVRWPGLWHLVVLDFLVWQHGRRTKALNERGKSLFTAASVWADYMLDCFVPPIVGIDGIAGDPLAGISVLFSGNYEFRRFCFSRTQKRA